MEWSRGKTIGRGSTSTVSIGIARGSGHIYAVKSAEVSQSGPLAREQAILSTLSSCPQLVAYQGHDVTKENNGTFMYNLFLELAPRGSLEDEIRRNRGRLDEATVRTYTRQIVLGLNHLHSNGIVHCDIKTQNILVTDEGVKIADFGCAGRIDDEVSVSHGKNKIAGTPMWMAPEVARGEQQGFPADVWALGCTVIEMLSGRAPWSDSGISDPVSALYRIGFSGEVPGIPDDVSKRGRDFLSKCLVRDPTERWSVGKLLNHEFLAGPTSCSNGSGSDSPTGVLDRGFWDSVEEFETSRTPKNGCSLECAKDRIERLRLEGATSFSGEPHWEWDDDEWVTVRNMSNADEHGMTSGEVYTRAVLEGHFDGAITATRPTTSGCSQSSTSRSICIIINKKGQDSDQLLAILQRICLILALMFRSILKHPMRIVFRFRARFNLLLTI